MSAPVVPRPAATTLILRQGAPGLEVLMVRRSMQASFMPGAYVFPGGGVDAADGSPEHLALCDEAGHQLRRRIGSVMQVGDRAEAYAVGALRECFEECGLWLGAAEGDVPPDGWAGLRARLNDGASMASLAADHGLRLGTSALQPWSHCMRPPTPACRRCIRACSAMRRAASPACCCRARRAMTRPARQPEPSAGRPGHEALAAADSQRYSSVTTRALYSSTSRCHITSSS